MDENNRNKLAANIRLRCIITTIFLISSISANQDGFISDKYIGSNKNTTGYNKTTNEQVSLAPIYNKNFNITQFNITCFDCKIGYIDIQGRNCTDNTISSDNSYSENLDVSSILIPHVKFKFRIKNGCDYIISVPKLKYKKIQRVPECIEDFPCNCNNFNFTKKNFTISWIDENHYKIFSEVDYKDDLNVNNVEIVLSNGSRNKEIFVRKILTDVSNIKSFEYEIDLKGISVGMYDVTLIYNNKFNCQEITTLQKQLNVSKAVEVIKNSNTTNIALIIISILLVAVIIYIFIIKTNFKKCYVFQKNNPIAGHRIDNIEMKNNLLYVTEVLPTVHDSYEIPNDKIKLIHEIGTGAFGTVFLGKVLDDINNAEDIPHVAIKQLNSNTSPEALRDMFNEIDIMKQITDHRHIIRLLGYCTKEEPYMIISEFVPCGDLRQYLIDLRYEWNSSVTKNILSTHQEQYIIPDSPLSEYSEASSKSKLTYISNERSPLLNKEFDFLLERVLDHKELQNFALQIAKGMAHLESLHITHRDLAARNVLITSLKTLKISDFGLSRSTVNSENTEIRKIPLRWTGIEVLENSTFYTKSDVWSFAIVLWEIGTLGAYPYESIKNEEIKHFLQNGGRLERPPICSDDLYNLMLRCWSTDLNLRPSFHDLVDLLDIKKKRIYVDFNFLNPTYVFPPTKTSHTDTY